MKRSEIGNVGGDGEIDCYESWNDLEVRYSNCGNDCLSKFGNLKN